MAQEFRSICGSTYPNHVWWTEQTVRIYGSPFLVVSHCLSRKHKIYNLKRIPPRQGNKKRSASSLCQLNSST